jgi:hypothetical protein
MGALLSRVEGVTSGTGFLSFYGCSTHCIELYAGSMSRIVPYLIRSDFRFNEWQTHRTTVDMPMCNIERTHTWDITIVVK